MILSLAVGYDRYDKALDECYDKYEALYDMSFDITQEEYAALSSQDLQRYDEAAAAISADEEAIYLFNMLVRLMLVIITVALLLAHLVLEFAVPLWLKNGQTLGKKIFGVALMRSNFVEVNTVTLFIRTVLGKFTIETMIPVLVCCMVFAGTIGIVGPGIVGLLLLAQALLLAMTPNRTPIHDCLATTVAVDLASQRIFPSEEAVLEYKKRIAAEKSAKQVY
jgi:uncharacterized RDD family membrane protein YckC